MGKITLPYFPQTNRTSAETGQNGDFFLRVSVLILCSLCCQSLSSQSADALGAWENGSCVSARAFCRAQHKLEQLLWEGFEGTGLSGDEN